MPSTPTSLMHRRKRDLAFRRGQFHKPESALEASTARVISGKIMFKANDCSGRNSRRATRVPQRSLGRHANDSIPQRLRDRKAAIRLAVLQVQRPISSLAFNTGLPKGCDYLFRRCVFSRQ